MSPALYIVTSPSTVNVDTFKVVSASTSESFGNNPFAAITVKVVFSVVEFESGFATGSSFTGVIVISNNAGLEVAPLLSLMV